MWRCRNCKQEVAEKDLVLSINPSGGQLYLCECGGVVDFFTDIPQSKAITGRSSIICECGASTWVRSQEGVSTCLYCGRQPVPATQGNLTPLAVDACPYCRGKRYVRHPNYGVSAVCPRCHGSGRATKA